MSPRRSAPLCGSCQRPGIDHDSKRHTLKRPCPDGLDGRCLSFGAMRFPRLPSWRRHRGRQRAFKGVASKNRPIRADSTSLTRRRAGSGGLFVCPYECGIQDFGTALELAGRGDLAHRNGAFLRFRQGTIGKRRPPRKNVWVFMSGCMNEVCFLGFQGCLREKLISGHRSSSPFMGSRGGRLQDGVKSTGKIEVA